MMICTLLLCAALTVVGGATTPSLPQDAGYPVDFPIVLPAEQPPGQGEAPQFGNPEEGISEGEVEEPEVELPEVELPEFELPEVEEPEGEEPEVGAPESEEPEVEIPEGEEPAELPENEGEGEGEEVSSFDKLILALLLAIADQSNRPSWDQRPFPCRFPNAPGCNPPGQGEGQEGHPGQGHGHGRPSWWRGGSGLSHGPEAENSAP